MFIISPIQRDKLNIKGFNRCKKKEKDLSQMFSYQTGMQRRNGTSHE